MKHRIIVTILCLLLTHTNVMANSDKNALLLEFIEISGLSQVLVEAKNQEIKTMNKSANQLLDLLVKQHPNLSDQSRKEAHEVYQEYANAIVNSYTVQDTINKWVNVYDSKFTKKEIRELIRFYKSDIGIKSVELGVLANNEYASFINKKTNEAAFKTLPVLNIKINRIIDNHRAMNETFLSKLIRYLSNIGSKNNAENQE